MPTVRTSGSDIPLPPMELRLMHDSDERFTESGIHLAELLFRLGLKPKHRLLDVGCSVARLPIGLFAGTDFEGGYVGFDVMKKQVLWARNRLTPILPNSRFRYVDVRNDRYNPQGAIEPSEMRFPAHDNQFHMACLFSIFTHFYREDIRLYLAELRRVLRPGGIVVATWFLYQDDRLDAAVRSSTYPMTHRLDEVTIYNNPDDPLRAIAFHEPYVRQLISEAGLEIVDIEHGLWAGGPGPEFQDVVVLRRPIPMPPTSQRLKAGVRRRLGRARRRMRSLRRGRR